MVTGKWVIFGHRCNAYPSFWSLQLNFEFQFVFKLSTSNGLHGLARTILKDLLSSLYGLLTDGDKINCRLVIMLGNNTAV